MGGDNLDQALAFQLESEANFCLVSDPIRRFGSTDTSSQRNLFALGNDAPESLSITVLGGGSRLIGGSQKFEVSRDTLLEQIRSGFFLW
ncbi:hypothetical protein [Marinomonas rhodophyticola]|uniref:Uncharacterized protein n=1 Tax=Marinomonas rhodophyticola TaxID=2992803 RepID=A0ABT3KDC6_9GAMM|nr:hypothetical protein [Marinomonas sp. KJ51-3]MCW4628542.1 hypothetical protein [Marinomonas sp. KJ51-3]